LWILKKMIDRFSHHVRMMNIFISSSKIVRKAHNSSWDILIDDRNGELLIVLRDDEYVHLFFKVRRINTHTATTARTPTATGTRSPAIRATSQSCKDIRSSLVLWDDIMFYNCIHRWKF
jgi:hypothetical protein